jgi:hypothetical protein
MRIKENARESMDLELLRKYMKMLRKHSKDLFEFFLINLLIIKDDLNALNYKCLLKILINYV